MGLLAISDTPGRVKVDGVSIIIDTDNWDAVGESDHISQPKMIC